MCSDKIHIEIGSRVVGTGSILTVLFRVSECQHSFQNKDQGKNVFMFLLALEDK